MQMGWLPAGFTPSLPWQLDAQSTTLRGKSGLGQHGPPLPHVPPSDFSRRHVAQSDDTPATRTWQSGLHSFTFDAHDASELLQSDSHRGSDGPSCASAPPEPAPSPALVPQAVAAPRVSAARTRVSFRIGAA